MAPVDSLLKLFIEHGADELRLAAGEAPRMLARGRPLKLILPHTSDDMLRHLLGPLLDDGREAALTAAGSLEFEYRPEALRAAFHVVLRRRPGEDGGLEAAFRTGGRPAAAAAAPAAIAAPATSAAPATAAAPAAPLPAAVPRMAPPPLDEAAAPASLSTPASAAIADASLAVLIAEARALRASDLHLMGGAVPVVRIDGALRPLAGAPTASLEALLGDVPPAALRAALGGGPAYDGTFDFEDRRVRLHVYRAAAGPAAALRLLPRAAPSLSSLHLPVELGDLALLSNGLVLVCGPTGSGKSATLAALAQEALARRAALLVTLEDPIEYLVQPGADGLVRQRQVGRDVVDFPTGLRDALREDPDVLLIGELRDSATVALALTAAETGHLVLASLHSRSAASAVERILDALPGRRESEVRAQLSQALRAVIAQRLVPRARGGGRVAVLEILRANHNIVALIRDGKTAQNPNALQSRRKEGMVLLEAGLAELVRSGAISREHATAAANDTVALAGLLEARGG